MWHGLARLVAVFAIAMAAFAARASDISDPRIWNPNTWYLQYLLTGGPSEMRFIIARSSAVGCKLNCPEWISAEGAITADTPALLKRVLKKLGTRKLPIIVNSPGGDVDAALQLGRIIRKNGLDIAIGDVHQAMMIDPEDPTLLEDLDRLLGASGKDDERIQLWHAEAHRLEEGAKRAKALSKAANLAESIGRHDEALAALRSAWVAAPGLALPSGQSVPLVLLSSECPVRAEMPLRSTRSRKNRMPFL